MDRALILDTETTGLDPSTDDVVEIGAVLFDLTHASPIECYSTLVSAPENRAEAVNGIPSGLLQSSYAADVAIAWARVDQMGQKADVLVAHNAAFDVSFAPSIVRHRLPVADTMDVVWPRAASSRSLVSVCLAHGVGVSHAHRALTDCLLIARLFERVHEMGCDLRAMLAHAMRPKVKAIAIVSYDDRAKAKEAGFQWDGATRQWWRIMPDEDRAALGFETRVEKQ